VFLLYLNSKVFFVCLNGLGGVKYDNIKFQQKGKGSGHAQNNS